jgi:large subunit ribosomal protein L10
MEVNTRMPNAKVLSEKQAIVAQLTEKIQKATAGVIVDYKGITVEEDTALRKECRESNVDYAVVKNTLLRFAFNNTGLNDLDDLLNGTTSLALSDDAVAPARVMADYAKKLDGKFEIKGGFMDGKPVDLATINSLASIPALPILQAQVLGTMLAPITGLAVVLKQIAEKGGEAAAPAEEAATAEEAAPAPAAE